jgi:dienelactone hydrolase
VGDRVEIGTARGYLAAPPAGAGPGVVVLAAPDVEEVCDRFAAEGFTALAPEGDAGAAVDHLESSEKVRGEGVGVVGFAVGAEVALRLAAERPDDVKAVVTFGGAVAPPELVAAVQEHDADAFADEEAARTAWVRTPEFLRSKLG